MRKILFLFLFLAFGLSSSLAAPPTVFKVGEFSFKRPADWEWIETTSQMRKAQLRIGKDSETSPEVVFFYFGEQGAGGTQANIDRWLGQFQESKDKLNSKAEEVTIQGRKVTYVQAEGTYKSGMPGGPQTPLPNHMLHGAILESKQGNVFVRMTGPKEAAKTASPEFRKMIESALRVGP